MCGRFSLWSDKNKIIDQFNLRSAPELQSNYNVIPSSSVPVIYSYEGNRVIALRHWGLIPHWAKDKKYKQINARSETLSEKPFFRDSFKNRRCLIPANGFYEWQGTKSNKQPYYIKLKDNELFAFAGLWDAWKGDDKTIESCTIITTAANEVMAPIHERMPVILDRDNYDQWLNEGATELLAPYSGEIDIYPVSTKVNKPSSNSAELMNPVVT